MQENNNKKIYKILKALAFVFVILAGARFLFMPLMGGNKMDMNVISFTGHGEVKAVPDVANIYFSIKKDAKTVKEAQELVAEIENKVLEFLKTEEIDEKDIKTENASFNPKYEFKYQSANCVGYYCPPVGKNVIVGYEAYENINLKIRNTDKVSVIIEGLGKLGVSELNGPNFSVDNEDELKIEARRLAIEDAKSQSKILSKDLGVRLGKIISFNEGANYPVPIYDSVVGMGMKAMEEVASSRAEIPAGENTISSHVTITYKIR